MLPPRKRSCPKKSTAFRRLFSEQLEERRLLASDLGENYDEVLEAFIGSQHLPAAERVDVDLEFNSEGDIAEQWASQHLVTLGAQADDFEIAHEYVSGQSGADLTYLQQTHEGIDILNAVANVSTWDDGGVVNVFSSFVEPEVRDTIGPSFSATQALSSLATELEWLDGSFDIVTSTDDAGNDILLAEDISDEPIGVEQAYVPRADGTIELAWRLNVQRWSHNQWLDASVSTSSGEVLAVANWVANASYEVFSLPKESPYDGDRTIEVDPHDDLASPFGWHDLNGIPGADTTLTRGTNVNAYTDVDADNQPDANSSPDGGSGLDFRAPLDLGQAPSTYRDAAVINLFYWNNVIHDVLANHGFTEASGNFQAVNYSGAGIGGDAVNAEAQDGSGLNNANFATPPDGIPGRMQMFVFNISNPDRISSFENSIISHEYGHGLSNRLTGGAANSFALQATQSRGMGEGWSDYLGLILSQQVGDQATDARGIGTYVLDQPITGAGIRSERYSYDMSVNTKTLNSISGLFSVHQIGETWASTLWDLNWALIDGKDLDPNFDHEGLGFDSDYHRGTGGNNMALRLVVEAMKLQPALPSFTEARDAILQADRLLNCGAYQDTIWRVFARRGMGLGASAGLSSNTNVTEAFDVPMTLRFGEDIATYTENQPAVLVNPELEIRNTDAQPIAGMAVNIRIRDADAGDRITLIESGTGSGQVSTTATQILFEGNPVANYTVQPGGQLSIRFTAATELSAQAVLRAVGFENTTEGPSSRPRHIEFDMGGVVFQCAEIDVIGLNDSPIISSALVGPILEDTTEFIPFQIDDIYETSFTDFDPNSSMSGLAVVGAAENLDQGTWFYSTSGNNWQPLGAITDSSESIVLSSTTYLAFVPADDYFGISDPLQVHALDDSYVGGFSDSVNRVALDPQVVVSDGPASGLSDLSAEVIKVNDPPVATIPSLTFTLDQGTPIDQVLDDGIFVDPDSPLLTWNLVPDQGFNFPSWLNLDSTSRLLSGTPANRDVGATRLMLVASDEEAATASIPVFVNVINVNDAPTGLRASGDAVAENDISQPIAKLFAIDVDVSDQITWTVSDPRFTIREDELWLNEPLDYEAEQEVNIVLTATDDGTPNLSSSLNLSIEVLDVNEHLPVINGGDILIEDGTPAGTLIRDFDAVDQDLLQTVTYRLVEDGDFTSFAIDNITGALTITEEARFASQPSYRIFVEAIDSGSPSKSRVTQLNVNVEPVNAFPPTMASPQSFTLSENQTTSTSVGFVVASDDDGDSLTFNLLSGSDRFSIDPVTGEVTTVPGAQFDFETEPTVSFLVRATEQTEPNRSVTGTVTITIADANDPPTGLSIDNVRFPVSRQGLVVGDLSVTDPDAQPSSYSFSTLDDRFEIIGNTLKLKDDAAVASADAGFFDLTLQVTDANDPNSTASLQVTLEAFAAAAWTNLALPNDVTRDGVVVPRDALLVINELNTTNGGMLSNPRTLAEQQLPDFDTNGDGFLSAVDALGIINELNSTGGEAEADGIPFDFTGDREEADGADWLTAYFELEEENRRRGF